MVVNELCLCLGFDSFLKEAVSEPVGPGSEGPFMPVRGQLLKQVGGSIFCPFFVLQRGEGIFSVISNTLSGASSGLPWLGEAN